MQVSQLGLVDSHAIIGGEEARAFQMSDSAEFFTVLSSTLYRDKKRAVVREVVCNAWDAHIVSGKTDIPVEISLSDTELTIKDFGPGIHDDLIADIYCTYGGSTKAHDGKQTGGFGLGSKAPFAYSDHFTVTSCHKGVKSVYAVSRGGVETGGRPGIRRMVCVPTSESGLTVSIPIRDSKEDREEFRSIIKSVVSQGDINAKLNDIPLPRIDYTEMKKHGFMTSYLPELSESCVYVLYGSVLYPVTSADKDVIKLLGRTTGLLGYDKLIIHAPANSIGITPSRESISYTEPTKKVIGVLIERAIRILRAKVGPVVRDFFNKQLKEQGILGISADLSELRSISGGDFLTQMARQCAENMLSEEEAGRIAGKEAAKFYPKFRKQLLRNRSNVFTHCSSYYGHNRAVENILLQPFLKVVVKAGIKDGIYLPKMHYPFYDRGSDGFISVSDAKRFRTIHEIHNEIVVARNFSNAGRKIKAMNRLSKRHDGKCVFVIIDKKLTDEKIKEIQNIAARYKLSAVYAEPLPKAATPAKPKTAEFLTPIAVKSMEGVVNVDTLGGYAKITDPQFYIPVAHGCRTRLPFKDMKPIWLAREFHNAGSKVAVATSAAELEELKKKGVKSFILEIAERFEELRKDRACLFQGLSPSDFYPDKDINRLSNGHYYAVDLAQADKRFADLLFGIKLKDDSQVEKFQSYRSALMACEAPVNEEVNRFGIPFSRIHTLVQELRTDARKKFSKLMRSENRSNVSFLSELCDLVDRQTRERSLNIKYRMDTLYTVIRALKRESDANSRNTNALKEAA